MNEIEELQEQNDRNQTIMVSCEYQFHKGQMMVLGLNKLLNPKNCPLRKNLNFVLRRFKI
jgi:hypothetical protein